jgi:hypothetical protein
MSPRLALSLMICLVVSAVLLVGCWTSAPKPAPGASMTWKLVAVGDCTGLDVETTEGSIPDDALAKTGYTAVCWDGTTYSNKNQPKRAFCTYKKVAYEKCTNGGNTGEMYTAVAR